MNSEVNKQYMILDGKPVLWYCLETFQKSFIDEIILVVGQGQIEYCQKLFVEKYQFTKITQIVEGGCERYHSVYKGIQAVDDCDYLYIHDGARPFVKQEHLNKLQQEVCCHGACVLGVPIKDTIKIADENDFGIETPNRKSVWIIQTPQVFSYKMIRDVYELLITEEERILEKGILITDDAMVIEYFQKKKIKFVLGSYSNIKITTIEDMRVAEVFCGSQERK